MKLKNLLLFSILSIAITACDDEVLTIPDCIDSSQVEGTNWFQEYIAQFEGDKTGFWHMSSGIYQSQRVFLPGNCCPYCLTIPSVLNCQGEQIGVIGRGDGNINPDDITDIELVWRSENYGCTN